MSEGQGSVVTFNGDVCRFYDEETKQYRVGTVIRCWRDEPPPESQLDKAHPHLVPLKTGRVVLSMLNEVRKEVSEQDLTVLDRLFLNGDVVKRDIAPATAGSSSSREMHGVVLSTESTYKLAPYFVEDVTPYENDERFTFRGEELLPYCLLARGELVVYQNWIGTIEEVIEAAAIEIDGQVTRTCGPFGSFWLGGLCDADMTGTVRRTAYDIQQTAVSVNWLCMNQLEPETSEAKTKRPPRYWNDLSQLSLVRSYSSTRSAVGDAVRLVNQADYARLPDLPVPDIVSRLPSKKALVITGASTRVHVKWQDGTSSVENSSVLQQWLPVDDDLDAYPGDMVAHVPAGAAATAETRRAGIVQSMNPSSRTARLRWYGTDQEETVPAIEIDWAGSGDAFIGVRVPDAVLIAPPSGNGLKAPLVPRLGESETLSGLWPSLEEHRAAIALVGVEAALLLTGEAKMPKMGPATSDIRWCAVTRSTNLDGSVTIEYPDGTREQIEIERLYQLDDGRNPHADDMFADEDEWSDEEGSLMDSLDGHEDKLISELFNPPELNGAVDEMIDIIDEEGDLVETIAAPGRMSLDSTTDAAMTYDDSTAPPETLTGGTAAAVSMPSDVEDDERWQRFATLEEAPTDHHFIKQPFAAASSKGFTARLRKEYGILSSSLPPNILVRVYEDRTDLIRCLIIGPTGTPFANAPFLFDIYLDPNTYPRLPPQVFFHSWAGGTRVSPNLYAEGKVCLSLLGTWQSGDVTESWSPTGSTLLQVFVSIQALIMVPEPYYTEPGLEKEKGSERGATASMHYSERTYALTRGFVKRVCEHPPAGYEAEIDAYYLDGLPSTGPGALAAIVTEGQQLVEESERWNKENGEDAKRPQSAVIPSLKIMTEGACIALKRTLEHLAKIQETKANASTVTSSA